MKTRPQTRRRRRRHHVFYILAYSLLTLLFFGSAFPPKPWKRRRDHSSSSLFLASDTHDKLFSRRLFCTMATSCALVGTAEMYSRIASLTIDESRIKVNPNVTESSSLKEVTIIFHGAGGLDTYTDELIATLVKHNRNNNINDKAVVFVHWNDYSSNLLQASANGRAVGNVIAKQVVAKQSNLQRIHVIGISVGAFSADSFVLFLKKKLPSIYIQETLLDPFQQLGILDIKYGKRNFGTHADYAQQFLNTASMIRMICFSTCCFALYTFISRHGYSFSTGRSSALYQWCAATLCHIQCHECASLQHFWTWLATRVLQSISKGRVCPWISSTKARDTGASGKIVANASCWKDGHIVHVLIEWPHCIALARRFAHAVTFGSMHDRKCDSVHWLHK